jgi:hypothetical protein
MKRALILGCCLCVACLATCKKKSKDEKSKSKDAMEAMDSMKAMDAMKAMEVKAMKPDAMDGMDPMAKKPDEPRPAPKPEWPKKFTQFKLPKKPMPYKAGEMVWAPMPNKGFKGWAYRQVRFKKAVDDHAEVYSLSTALIPSAFLEKVEPPKRLKRGQPVLAFIGMFAQPARVVKMMKDKAKVTYCTVTGFIGTKEYPLTALKPFEKGKWVGGAPIEYQEGKTPWVGDFLAASEDKVWFLGKGNVVMERPKKDVKLIDLQRPLRRGAKVWSMPKSGFAGRVYMEARIKKVLKGGVGYEIKAEKEKKIWKTCYALVIKRK